MHLETSHKIAFSLAGFGTTLSFTVTQLNEYLQTVTYAFSLATVIVGFIYAIKNKRKTK